MRRFDQDVKAPGIMFKEATRETPEFLGQTIVIVPLSIGVGVTVLFGALLICWGLKQPARAALVVGGLVMAVCALVGYWRIFADQIYLGIETIIGHDLDGDGFIGPPPEPQEDYLILKRDDMPNHTAYVPIAENLRLKLPAVASRIISGTPFSESAMTGTGRPLTRSEFLTLRDIFFQQQLCRWKDPEHHTLGVEFTGYGRSFLRQYAEGSTTPPRIHTQGGQNVLPPGR